MGRKLIKPNIDVRVYIPEDLYIQYKLIQKEHGLPKGFFSQFISSVLERSLDDFKVKCEEIKLLREGLMKKSAGRVPPVRAARD